MSVQKLKNTVYKTRIVNTNIQNNGSSASWRSDYYMFKGLTYAQIVRLPATKDQNNSQKPSATKLKCQVRTEDLAVSPSRAQVAPIVKTPCTSNQRKRGDKVIVNSYCPVSCHKKFAILAEDVSENSKGTDKVQAHDSTVAQGGTNIPRVRKTGSPEKRLSRKAIANKPDNQHSNITGLHNGSANENVDDKYTFMLGTKPNSKSYKPALQECKTLQLWDKQTHRKFGFIPLADQILPEKSHGKHHNLGPLEMHEII